MRHFAVIAVILIYLISFAVDFYIYKDICKYLRNKVKRDVRIIFCVLSALCYIAITVAIVQNYAAYTNVNLVMWLLFSFFSIYIPKFIYVILSAIGRLFKWRKNGKPINYLAIAGVSVAVLLFVVIWWGALFTRHEIKVDTYTYTSSKLPEAFNNYRIVQFSDAHVGTWGSDTTFVSNLVSDINSLNPDLIVFTGDVVNRETKEMKPFLSILSRLKAKDGVYSILGNHDYGDYTAWKTPREKADNLRQMLVWQDSIGWKLLNNTHVQLNRNGESIALIGVENWGEPPFKRYGNLEESYFSADLKSDALNDNKFKILLTHNPKHWDMEVLKKSNIDLTLSGHTHAMQMEFGKGENKWSPSKYVYPEWDGVYNKKNSKDEYMTLIVSRGCGQVGIPARYGTAYPQINVITLKTPEHEKAPVQEISLY